MHVTGQTAPARWRTDIDVEGHEIVSDEPAEAGGAGAGLSPFALVLAGLASCTATTLRMYAERKNWDPITIRVELDLSLARDARRIHRKVLVSGAPDAGLERLRDIVERTPVTLALKPGFEIVTVLEAAPSAAEESLDEALEETFPASDPISPA